MLVASLQADAFCHSMVRALVGACVAVGEGKLDADPAGRPARSNGARTSEFKVMPAHGLTLTEVGYPEDAELAHARGARPGPRRELPTTLPALRRRMPRTNCADALPAN